jgi:hypothetical protein
MGTFLIRFNERFRRLVVSLRRTGLCGSRGGPVGRDSCEVGSPSLDFRPARLGTRPEFRQMVQRYRVDLARASLDLGSAVCEAELICVNCQDVRRCRHWLVRETIDDPRLFCANAPLFKVLAAKQAKATMRPIAPGSRATRHSA